MTFTELINKIKEFEGFRSRAYRDSGGTWTIGFGRVAGVKAGDSTNREAEENWLVNKVETIREEVRRDTYDQGYSFNDDQILALTDFVFNLGLGKLRTLTKTGERTEEEISNKILEYDKCRINGVLVPLAGLTKRRKFEKDLFDGKFSGTPTKNPTAKELQILINEVSNAGLEVDGKIGKKSIKAIYEYITGVSK